MISVDEVEVYGVAGVKQVSVVRGFGGECNLDFIVAQISVSVEVVRKKKVL